LYFPF
jgi:calcium-dependent protein kinase